MKKSALAWAALSVPGCSGDRMAVHSPVDFKTRNPRKALVLWYSQTGHTRRYGEYAAHVLKESGLKVDACDIRYCKSLRTREYDLIIAGTPVHYMDVPPNVKEWFMGMAVSSGTAAASYSTFGGHGDNQHNTAFELLSLMVENGAAPAGMSTFGNMSTYAPTWSLGNEKKTLKYAHLPDSQTYSKVREFTKRVLDNVRRGVVYVPEKEFDIMDWVKHLPVIWGSKVLTTDHRIIEEDCIGCGACERVCPVGAISPKTFKVDESKCLLCLGCVNNCPVGAVNMNYLGKKVIGFPFFLEEQGVEIMEPPVPASDADEQR